MNWDHPDNFKFPLLLLQAQSRRIQILRDYLLPQGIVPAHKSFGYFWGLPGLHYASPNAVLEAWSRHDVLVQPDFGLPPTFSSGPVWTRTVTSPYRLYLLSSSDFGPYEMTEIPEEVQLVSDIRDDLQPKTKWEVTPTFEEIWSVLSSQIYSQIPTSFVPSWGSSEVTSYREDFVLFLMKRAKLIWEVDYPYPAWTTPRCDLGSGRIPLEPIFDAPASSYRYMIYFVLREGDRHMKLYEIKPGCCSRFRK